MKTARMVLGLAAIAALAGSGAANGTIDTAGSTIAAGASPQAGAVTLDASGPPGPAPAHPSIGTAADLGTIGTLANTIPAFPGGGSGAGGAFHATSDVSLPGGTHEFTSFEIDPNVTVHALGSVVIRTTGNVDLNGLFVVDVTGGDAVFECAGDMTVRAISATPVPGVQTFSGLIKFDVAGELQFIDVSPVGSEATTAFGTQGGGDVDFIARGGTQFEFGHCNLFAKNVRMRSASKLFVNGVGINVFGVAEVRLQAFGGDVEISRSTIACNGAIVGPTAGKIVVEASGGIASSLGFLYSRGGDTALTAFGGSIDLDRGYVHVYEGGDIRLRASGGVALDGIDVSILEAGGQVDVAALGGDLDMSAQPGNPSTQARNDGTGSVSLGASGGITLAANGIVKTANGDVTLRAYDGGIAASGNVTFDAVSGALDVGGTGDVTAATGGTIRLAGDSVRVVGGRIDLAADVTARAGDATFLAAGALACVGTIGSSGDLTGTAIAGDVTLDGAAITTAPNAGAASGDIRFTSYAGASAGRIAARNATIRSGDHATASGDVALRIVTVPRPTVAAYLLPTDVSVKLGAARGAGIRATGAIGSPAGRLGAGAPASVPFTFEVGARQIAGDLSLRGKGLDREFKAAGVLLRVSPSATGTSRGVFSLRIDGDLTGHVPADGLLTLRLQAAGSDLAGTVRLAGGKFKLGSVRGAVTEFLYPLAVTATRKGAGKDAFAFALGFASAGLDAATFDGLALDFAGSAFVVDAADLARSGDRFTAKNPPSAPGLALVVVDFDAETVQVKAKGLDLPALDVAAPVVVRIGAGFGGDLRSVDVTLARKGAKLTW